MRYHPDCKMLIYCICGFVCVLLMFDGDTLQHDGGYGFAEFDDREDARDAVKVSFV